MKIIEDLDKYKFNENDYLASIDMNGIDEPDPAIPIFINRDGAYTITRIENIGSKNITISKFLRNIYEADNITYMETKAPINVNRALKRYGHDVKIFSEYKEFDFFFACDKIRIDLLNADLEFLKEHLWLDKELIKECQYEIKKKNSGKGLLYRTYAWLDFKETILNSIGDKLKKIYAERNAEEFKLYLFSMYMQYKGILFSKPYWDDNYSDMYIYVASYCRGTDNEKI